MKLRKFGAVLAPALALRFYLGEDTFTFLWFAVLYLPLINWSVYWLMCTVRIGLHKLRRQEWITEPQLKGFYIWYLHVPGALVLADLIYRGYIFNFQ
ncbi:hypothetical protein [Ammoniphilus sp. YIM 78166]|uniref:hypothetical protein n=1 Tax=Ammoniphilus sp. YIM 78166 TaxID=1644106 RepID=UPI00106F75FE|nr:hypothetical protein [Ammoniphilus sp. YIM 78166]